MRRRVAHAIAGWKWYSKFGCVAVRTASKIRICKRDEEQSPGQKNVTPGPASGSLGAGAATGGGCSFGFGGGLDFGGGFGGGGDSGLELPIFKLCTAASVAFKLELASWNADAAVPR